MASPILLMVGLMLLTVAAIQGDRWTWSAVWLALSCMLKLYPLALGLVLMLIYPRRFAGRFLVLLALGLVLPFALHAPDYVVQQYANWWHVLRVDDRSQITLHRAYRDVWLLSDGCNCRSPKMAYQVVQGVTALLVGGSGRWLTARPPNREIDGSSSTASSPTRCCWMILLGQRPNPALTSCSGRLLAWTMVEAWRSSDSRPTQGTLAGQLRPVLAVPASRHVSHHGHLPLVRPAPDRRPPADGSGHLAGDPGQSARAAIEQDPVARPAVRPPERCGTSPVAETGKDVPDDGQTSQAEYCLSGL